MIEAPRCIECAHYGSSNRYVTVDAAPPFAEAYVGEGTNQRRTSGVVSVYEFLAI
jgi:hypothetical protein